MDRADALHLLRRTGFTVRTAELDEIAGLSREVAVDRLLDFSPNTGPGPSPEVNNVEGKRWEQIRDLRLWWIDRMQTSPRQLQEKMVMFWHSHFATAADTGYYAYYAWDQNSLFRAKAVGDFKSLVHEVAVGPAMLVYLDNYRNKAGNPNENFARELLELHLLGPENYDESDIPEVAKAWTGYMLDEEKYVHEFHPQHHDYRNKTIFGITRDWNGPQVIDEILTGSKKTASARFIAKKLFEYFAYADPSTAVVNRLADDFIAGGHQIWVLVRNILLSDEFWSAKGRKAMVRSPVEFVVACMQGAGSNVAEARPDWRLKTMGMELFDPPNPSGWQQNGFWVSSTAQWSKADFARNLSWKAVNRDFLNQIEWLGVPDAVAIALSLFGVEDASPKTRQALENYLYAERATDEWPQQANLLTLTMMTPDIQVA